MISGFNEVFEYKLKRIKEKLKVYLSSPDKKLKKPQIKALLKEAKDLRHTLRKFEKDHKTTCPNCGHNF